VLQERDCKQGEKWRGKSKSRVASGNAIKTKKTIMGMERVSIEEAKQRQERSRVYEGAARESKWGRGPKPCWSKMAGGGQKCGGITADR